MKIMDPPLEQNHHLKGYGKRLLRSQFWEEGVDGMISGM